MYAPAQHDEVNGLVNYIDEQLTAIRAAAFGLTEAQARETPCRSALSVGGIIKHAAYVMRGALERLEEVSSGLMHPSQLCPIAMDEEAARQVFDLPV